MSTIHRPLNRISDSLDDSSESGDSDTSDKSFNKGARRDPKFYRKRLLIISKVKKIREQSSFSKFTKSPEFRNKMPLKEYQIDGLNWLYSRWFEGKNSLLADEMGLGKTIEVLALLKVLNDKHGLSGPHLVVAPLSMTPCWIKEITAWTSFKAQAVIGNAEERRSIIEGLLPKDSSDDLNVDIVVVSYECLRNELAFFSSIEWAFLVIDEAHRLKNTNTASYHSCSVIKSANVVLLTGTPVQNSVKELWSLLRFLDPDSFSSEDDFLAKYGNTSDISTVQSLQKLVRPYILRRKKCDVDKTIQAKEETVIEIELTSIQKTLYKSVLDDNRDILLQNLSKTAQNLNNIAMDLRKVCNHPCLIPGIDDMCFSQYIQMKGLPNTTEKTPDLEMESVIYASGKMILLDKLLPKLKETGHKVLIFSQMTSLLDLIEDYLNFRKYKYERIDGAAPVNERSRSIDRFSSDPSSFVFLLSTRSGGFGINLVAADSVILFDSDWNPQNDIQAQSRCHRIGQTNEVKVYRLITRGTYEEAMFKKASRKLALGYALLDCPDGQKQEAEELDMILRYGAYHVCQENDNEIEKFCSENIDQILEKRSKRVTNEVIGGESAFAKVSFEDTDNEIKNDDFWSKLLKESSQTQTNRRRRHSVEQTENEEYVFESPNEGTQPEEDQSDEDWQTEEESPDEDIPDPEPRKRSPQRLNVAAPKPQILLPVIPLVSLFQVRDHMIKYGSLRVPSMNLSLQSNWLVVSRLLIWNAYRVLNFPEKYSNYAENSLRLIKLNPLNAECLQTPPFDNQTYIQSIFSGYPDQFLSICENNDRVFKVASFLATVKLPDTFIPAASMVILPYWNPSLDYLFLCFLSDMGCGSELQAAAQAIGMYYGQSSFIPPSDWLNMRKELLINEVTLFIPDDFSYVCSALPPLDTFTKLQTGLFRQTTFCKAFQMKALRALFLFGLPINPQKEASYHKLHTVAGLLFIDGGTFKAFVDAVMIRCRDVRGKNLFSGLKFEALSTDVSWIPNSCIACIASSITFLKEVREVYLKGVQPQHLPVWDIAPESWSAQHDWVLLGVSAMYGFTTFAKFSEYLLNPDAVVAPTANDKLINESISLIPEVTSATFHLQFMFNIDVRKQRLRKIMDSCRGIVGL